MRLISPPTNIPIVAIYCSYCLYPGPLSSQLETDSWKMFGRWSISLSHYMVSKHRKCWSGPVFLFTINRISWGFLEKFRSWGKVTKLLPASLPKPLSSCKEGGRSFIVKWVIQVAKDVVERFLVTGSPHLVMNVNCGWMSNPSPFN